MSKDLKPSAQRVQDAVRSLGFDFTVLEFDHTTRTAAEAAAAIGCTVGQICKSLVFKALSSGDPILVIASGANRVNVDLIRDRLGEVIGRASPDFVRDQTGFAIGGVAPVGHTRPLTTFIDQDLLNFEEIWAAAGTPNAVFRLTPNDLVKMTGGDIIKVS